ncbi:MAG: hypothetical protein CME70_03415 [Halobacteriovorax sp.]|nr:hypothetical protein [Halobacteriovorax sp.]MBK23033.1 hypothetical protein [Halobacteriovorax sp.]|tara:strand:+ start:46687 stop:47496 length:810 start_codon:yes stop_codon:yes gene_type:complete
MSLQETLEITDQNLNELPPSQRRGKIHYGDIKTNQAKSKSINSLWAQSNTIVKKTYKEILESDIKVQNQFKEYVLLVKKLKDSFELRSELEPIFQLVIYLDTKTDLDIEEINEIRKTEYPQDYIIGGEVNQEHKVLTLYRGNFGMIKLPFSFFKSNAVNSPDFSKFKVIDGGLSVQLGDYEASAYNILYPRDPDYRKRLNKQRKKEDKTFGACLFRARAILGVNQDDFPGIDRKTISRIENNEVERILNITKLKILARLGITEEKLMGY